ncbi:MAG: catalase [Bacteroidia bacterium]|nr:catalase [Bacteroidia bacterium]
MTVGPRSPVLLQDFYVHEKLAHFNPERIPERVVHVKGTGAFDKFTVTKDISKYTSAKLFSKVCNSCRVLVCFSTVGGEKGSTDAEKQNTINNFVRALKGVTGPKKKEIILRQLDHFYKADKELALTVAKDIGIKYK